MTANAVQQALREITEPKRAEQTQTFFKTGPGEYSEGDRFLGIRVPHQRDIAKQYRDLTLPEVGKLLRSGYHEAFRFTRPFF
ncbi:MAG: DNA alkylation repair protein [Balneolaceae bacterium]